MNKKPLLFYIISILFLCNSSISAVNLYTTAVYSKQMGPAASLSYFISHDRILGYSITLQPGLYGGKAGFSGTFLGSLAIVEIGLNYYKPYSDENHFIGTGMKLIPIDVVVVGFGAYMPIKKNEADTKLIWDFEVGFAYKFFDKPN